MTIVTPQYTLQDVCEVLDVEPKRLAQLTGLHVNTVKNAIHGGEFYTHVGTALLIADALGMEIHEIKWPNGLSENGRPPLTTSTRVHRTVTITVKEETVLHHAFCPRCHLQLPPTKQQCETCQ